MPSPPVPIPLLTRLCDAQRDEIHPRPHHDVPRSLAHHLETPRAALHRQRPARAPAQTLGTSLCHPWRRRRQ